MRKPAWVFIAILYAAMVVAVILAMRYTRDKVAPGLATNQGQADWQAWREETAKQAHGAGPVARREQKTTEPPLVILMRDHYATCVAGAVVFSSVLFGVLVIVIRGAISGGNRQQPNAAQAD